MTQWNLKTPAGRLGAIRDGLAQWPERKAREPWPPTRNPDHPNVIGGSTQEWGNYDDGSDDAPDVNAHGITLRASLANDHLLAKETCGRLFDTLGYYTDREFQDETLVPIVARLSHGRALAGYTYGPGMSFSLDRTTAYPDVTEAAQAAHEYARVAAEAECEYQDLHREAEQRAERGEPCAILYAKPTGSRGHVWKLVRAAEVTGYLAGHGSQVWSVSERFGDDASRYIVTETRTYSVYADGVEHARDIVSRAGDTLKAERVTLSATAGEAATAAEWADAKPGQRAVEIRRDMPGRWAVTLRDEAHNARDSRTLQGWGDTEQEAFTDALSQQ